ncbi:MAG: leucine-rich repeat protein [bacterium]|nr:leucine-rich repeat protein [bacterium]
MEPITGFVLLTGVKMLYDTLVSKPRQERAAAYSRAAASRQASEQREFSAEESRKRREFESAQQQKRQEFEKQQLQARQAFDLMLNKRNADLQREMAWINHDYRLEEQEQSFNNQKELANYKAFLDKWPIMMPVEMLRQEHMQGDFVTLGVFLFKNRDRIDSEIDKFWDVNIYPLVESDLNEWVENIYRNSFNIDNIKFYRDSFRDDNAHHGSLVDIIRYALRGLPTVILESNVLPYELRLSFTLWGLGDDSTKKYRQYTFRKQNCEVKTENGWMSKAECRRLADWICACFKMIIGCNFDAFSLAQYNHMPVFPEIAKYELEQGVSGTPLLYEDLKKEFTGFYEGIYELLLGPESAFARDCANNKITNAHELRLSYAEKLKDFVDEKRFNKWLADSVEAWCALRGEKSAEEWLKGLLAGEYSRYQYFDADDEAYFKDIAALMTESGTLKPLCDKAVRLLSDAESADDLLKEARRLFSAEDESEKKLGLSLYRRAAEMGLAAAQVALGNCLFNLDSVEDRKAEAVSWYCKAAEQGNVIAQYKLGLCYSSGEGVESNKDEAMKWLTHAAEQGHDEAERKLAELKQDEQSAPVTQKIVKPEQLKVCSEVVVADEVEHEDAYSGRDDLTIVRIVENATSIGENAFEGCGNLSSVVIPDTVKTIGDRAFSYCENLRSIIIPASVRSIGCYAFRGCSNLETLVLPDSIISIGRLAFACCNKLNSITLGKKVYTDSDILNKKLMELNVSNNYHVWSKINKEHFVANYAYEPEAYRYNQASEITIPRGITSIGDEAFRDCANLRSVVIPEGVTSIGDEAFMDCASLRSVVIPEGVTSIGQGTFQDCIKLESVVIPGSLSSIECALFSGCESLESVVIPEGVTSIGDWAFNNCESLRSVVIPEGVTSIGEEAFWGCDSLENIVLPYSLDIDDLAESAFNSCPEDMHIRWRGVTYKSIDEFWEED